MLQCPKALAFRYQDSRPDEDPWLYFYEDFLAAYDPKLRKDAGAYYTPVEVVCAQVRLIDDLLTNRLGKPWASPTPALSPWTLPPAREHTFWPSSTTPWQEFSAEQGKGAVPGQATALAGNIYGFEIMVGPFAVSELRVSRALQDVARKTAAGGTPRLSD